MAFGKLRSLARRRSKVDGQDAGRSLSAAAHLDADDAAVGPPALLPAAIYRRLLFDATEFTPAWLTPRPAVAAAEPGLPTVEPSKPKAPKRAPRARQASPNGRAKPARKTGRT